MTVINISTGVVTVRVAEPLIEPKVAVTVVLPAAGPLARPCFPAVLLIVATAVFDEFHSAVAVRSCLVPSVKLPVAVNCCCVPAGIEGLAGVTTIDASAAPVTVSIVELLIDPDVAVIVVVPVPALVASPCVPVLLLITATLVSDELHTTVVVTSCML